MRPRKRKRATLDAHRVVHPTRIAMHHLFPHERPLVGFICGRCRDPASALVRDVCRG
jgi:hypothetical protein